MKRLAIAALFALGAAAAQGATLGLVGSHYDATSAVNSVASARANIANAMGPDSTFVSTGLSYANSSARQSLSSWLGAMGDGASVIGDDDAVASSVFVFEGFITLGAGVQSFGVQSDDGFELLVGGVRVDEKSRNRGFNRTPDISTFDAGAGGAFAFELLFWDGPGGSTGLNVTLNGAVIDDTITSTMPTAAIPVPAALPLLASALGLAGWVGGRRRR